MGESGKQTRLSVLHTNLTAKVSGRTKGVWTSWHCLAILDTAGFLGVTCRRLALSPDGDWFHLAALVVFKALFEGPISTIIGFVTLRTGSSRIFPDGSLRRSSD